MIEQKIFVIVGLGNPGKKYSYTRHNIGCLVLESLAEKWQWQLKENRVFEARTAKGMHGGAFVHLLFPTLYMNNSGLVVKRYLDYYRLKSRHLIVVSDDVALPFGTMRARASGSSGGHNGLKSIEYCLQTQEYMRIKMGIGYPVGTEIAERIGLADYVLSPFNSEEMRELPDFILRAVAELERLLA